MLAVAWQYLGRSPPISWPICIRSTLVAILAWARYALAAAAARPNFDRKPAPAQGSFRPTGSAPHWRRFKPKDWTLALLANLCGLFCSLTTQGRQPPLHCRGPGALSGGHGGRVARSARTPCTRRPSEPDISPDWVNPAGRRNAERTTAPRGCRKEKGEGGAEKGRGGAQKGPKGSRPSPLLSGSGPGRPVQRDKKKKQNAALK